MKKEKSMRIKESDETEGMWFVLNEKDLIIRIFYSKPKAMKFMKDKEGEY